MTRIEFIKKYAEQIALITEQFNTHIGFGRALPFDPDYNSSIAQTPVKIPTEPITHMTILSDQFENDLHEMLLRIGFELANIVPVQGGAHPKLLMSYRVPVGEFPLPENQTAEYTLCAKHFQPCHEADGGTLYQASDIQTKLSELAGSEQELRLEEIDRAMKKLAIPKCYMRIPYEKVGKFGYWLKEVPQAVEINQ